LNSLSHQGIHVQVVGAVHAAGAAAAQVGVPVGARVVGEVADPVGVQLRRQLEAAASEQQPAPERLVLVLAAEGVQLDRLQRKHQRIFRIRTAQDRRLNLPPVTLHEPPPFDQLIVPPRALTRQTIDGAHAVGASDSHEDAGDCRLMLG
jgi:hypothetical protein